MVPAMTPLMLNNRTFYLVTTLVQRDFKARYRRTFLRWIWAFVPPVVNILIFGLLNQVATLPSEGAPYLLFSTAAIVPWTFLSQIIARSPVSVLMNRAIIKKVAVPPELFLVVGIVSSAIEYLISAALILIVMLYFSAPVTLHLILWFPILSLLTALLGYAVGLGVTALAVYRRDFDQITTYLMRVMLFITPIGYPLSSVSEDLRPFFLLNPAVGLIEGFRSVIVFGQAPDLGLLALSVALTLAILVVTWPLYRVMSAYFADVL
jgi:lipopolysaccharide transport system permease protein